VVEIELTWWPTLITKSRSVAKMEKQKDDEDMLLLLLKN
tara:strand:+ start:1999 stop:2115 length:117 start_codon:yes stop_codon:yes gene_type:complete